MTKYEKAQEQQDAAVAVMKELAESFVAGTVAEDGLYKKRDERLRENCVVLADTDGATAVAKAKVKKEKQKKLQRQSHKRKQTLNEQLQQLRHRA